MRNIIGFIDEAVPPRPFPIETLTLQVLHIGSDSMKRQYFLVSNLNTPIQIFQELACASVTAHELTVLLHRRVSLQESREARTNKLLRVHATRKLVVVSMMRRTGLLRLLGADAAAAAAPDADDDNYRVECELE